MSGWDNAISGKVAVVTGASSGIGAATARLLAAEGARVVLGARRLDRLEALVAEIEAAGGAALPVAVDVARREQVKALVDAAVDRFGRVDAMINNAGIMPLGNLEADNVDDWDRMIDVNIRGVLHGISAALPHFRRQGSGHLLVVSSVAGHVVFPVATVYCGTKFAVRAIAEGFRQEVGPSIRTTVVSPGAVESELVDSLTDPAMKDAVKSLRDVAIPAEAIAQAVLYAMKQPPAVDVNEILVRPTAQSY